MNLIEAIKQNNKKEVFRLLDKKTDLFGKKFIDEVDSECEGSPLYWAAANGYGHFIGPLVKAGADVNKLDKYGRTPVFIAAQNGHAAAITQLKYAGADVDIPNSNGITPVYAAAQFRYAADVIRELRIAGANVNTPDRDGRTPVFIAAQNGHAAAITQLKYAGADVDIPNSNGITPVYVAVENRHVETVAALLEAGADAGVGPSWEEKTTPLEQARKKGYEEIVNLLKKHFENKRIKSSANLHQQSNLSGSYQVDWERTDAWRDLSEPMSSVEAIKNNNQKEFFRLLNKAFVLTVSIVDLVQAGIDVNKKNDGGETSVCIAAAKGHADVIRALKAAGANVNTPNANGETPVCIAAVKGHADVIRALKAAGANVNTQNKNYESPLHIAAKNGDIDVIKALTISGANLNVIDQNHKKPYEHAKGQEAIDLLTPVHKNTYTSDNIFEEEEQTTVSFHTTSSPPVVNDFNYPCLSREGFVLGGVVDIPGRVAEEPDLDGIKSIKKGFQSPHVKQKKSSNVIHYQGLKADRSRLKINSAYQYEDNDIQVILSARLQQLQIQNKQLFTKPLAVLAAVDNIVGTQLEHRLKQEQEANNHRCACVLLIPCNLRNAHWVGILLELRIDRTISRAEYVDSNDSHPTVPSTFQEQLQNVYPNAPLITVRKSLQQTDGSSCGAYTIENLLTAALGIQSPENSEIIRRLHLEALEQYNLGFYSAFYERQKNNRPTTVTLHQQLGYVNKLKDIWFSKPELNRILMIKRCVSSLPEKIQSDLLQAFEYKSTYEDDHAAHLNTIRKALKEAAQHESKSLVELIQLLFDQDWQPGMPLPLEQKFRVDYNEILAITKTNLAVEKVNSLQQSLAEKIQKDEQFALKLQAELWSDTVASNVDQNEVAKFLKLVAEGEQVKAEEMLNDNCDLALIPGDVTDLSNRTFRGITGFQYSIWALDWHMWTMLLKYMSFASTAKQAQSMETGIWVKEHGLSASWKDLIDAIHTYIDLCNRSSLKKVTTQWKTQVGTAQRLLPAHVVNEYCRPDRPFEPCPDFTTPCLPRTRDTKQGEWFTATCDNEGLGTTFAYFRYKNESARPMLAGHDNANLGRRAPGRVMSDYRACETLLTTRLQQRNELFIEQLIMPILRTFINIPSYGPIDIILDYLGMNTVVQKQHQSSGDSNHSPSTSHPVLTNLQNRPQPSRKFDDSLFLRPVKAQRGVALGNGRVEANVNQPPPPPMLHAFLPANPINSQSFVRSADQQQVERPHNRSESPRR
ncbi:MAG TPA: ankyrin repeat domain-containing protein [Gammaproteobacteria bacterium]|nr:ankyrin repeat domain-containing protein [Gammaproteobacteria bacterium]